MNEQATLVSFEDQSELKSNNKSSSQQDLGRRHHSLSQPQSPRARGRGRDNFIADYNRSASVISQLEKSKILMKMESYNKPLTILHYNDVYNVDATSQVEPIGGAARFCTAMKTFKDENPLVLFSGDIFSPSMCKRNTMKY